MRQTSPNVGQAYPRSNTPMDQIGADGWNVPEDTTQLHLKPRSQLAKDPLTPTDSAGILSEILDNMRSQDLPERSQRIIQQTAVTNYQLMAIVPVPFDFNAIQMNVIFGVIAVTYFAVTPSGNSALFSNLQVVDPATPFDLLFGASGVQCGDTSGNPVAVPIALCAGSQTQRIPIQPAGVVTIWAHGASYLDERHNINPTRLDDTCVFSGRIMRLNF